MDQKPKYRNGTQSRLPLRKLETLTDADLRTPQPGDAWQCSPGDVVQLYGKINLDQPSIGYVVRHSRTSIDIADCMDELLQANESRTFRREELNKYQVLARGEQAKAFAKGDLVEILVPKGSKRREENGVDTVIAISNPRRGDMIHTAFRKVGYVLAADRDGVKVGRDEESSMRIHYDALREAYRLVAKSQYAVD